MKKILLQAGHSARTSGSLGAPEEQKWTTEITPKIAQALRDKNFEVRVVTADPSDEEISGDWDLFLTLHYDADIYNDRGGFVDIPDPSVDFAHIESERIANEIRAEYFATTGIPERPERSNANTRFYYMWSRLSAKTPCVILEAGVGYRTPEDHHTLWFRQNDVIDGIVKGIQNALGEKPTEPETDPCESYKQEITELDNIIKQKDERIAKLEADIGTLQQQIDDHKCPVCNHDADSVKWVPVEKVVTKTAFGEKTSVKYMR